MMANEFVSALSFIIGLAISTIIIWIVTKLFGQKEGIGRAFLTAVIGAVVYSVFYFLLGNGWLAAIIGGIVWLLALRGLYDIGWLRAFVIAIIIWIAATIVGLLLPTAPGPL
jgi:CBS domain containing-hemolysin-like protein